MLIQQLHVRLDVIQQFALGHLSVHPGCTLRVRVKLSNLGIDAIVDGGQVIDERNESNNEMGASLTLNQPQKSEQEDLNSGISTTTIYVGSLIALIFIIVGFRFLAPAKIRKYE